MAALLAANLGELPIDPTLREAMRLTQRGIFKISPRNTQALAWEVNDFDGPIIVDKPGGLENSSSYIGMVPAQRLGVDPVQPRLPASLRDRAGEPTAGAGGPLKAPSKGAPSKGAAEQPPE